MKKTLLNLILLSTLLLFFVPTYVQAVERTLSVGLSGDDVVAMQTHLIARGYLPTGSNTGYFGNATLIALKKFQCDQKIVCANSALPGYGVYGPQTRAKLLSGVTLSTIPASPAWKGPLEFSGWIPYWRSATGTRDVLPHLSTLKSIMPFGYTVKSNGTLSDTAKLSEEPWTSFIAEAKKNKVRVIPTIMWGNGDSIHKILSNSKTRIALEDEIANIVKKNGFDGIDIDFEAKKHETIDYFSTFLKGLYQRMGNKWVYCTVEARMPLSSRYSPGAKIPADATDYANDYVQMNKYCDRVEIMAYDQGTIDLRLNKARSAPYAPVADPGWVENLVAVAAQNIDKKKLIIGVPTYGYEYAVTPLSGKGYKYNVLWAFNPNYAIDIAQKLGITPNRTSANEIGFSYDPKRLEAVAPRDSEATLTQQVTASSSIVQNAESTTDTSQPFNFLSWSDARAIADKVALAKKLGVRGVAVFKFDGGEDQKMWEVLR
jgi:spore germination protein YaaH